MPFLIVHGGADKVTDSSVSELLYRLAASQDKTLRIYPGMWHALTSVESPENMDAVFRDIIAWLDQQTEQLISYPRSSKREDMIISCCKATNSRKANILMGKP